MNQLVTLINSDFIPFVIVQSNLHEPRIFLHYLVVCNIPTYLCLKIPLHFCSVFSEWSSVDARYSLL